jgi:RNA 2',3'-cyclic 3'-phosphodiesterase
MDGAFEFYRDLPRRPKRPERLFFGLFSNSQALLEIDQFGDRFIRENNLKGRRLKPKRLHVSVHHVKDDKRLRSKFIYAATEAAKAISMAPFEVTFRLITSFESPPTPGRPRRWPLVLLGEGDGLFELHRILGAALAKYGLQTEEHFTPHMTLFYGSKPVPAQAIKPIRLMFNEFVLIHSELWLTRYNILDRWRLKD